jgi:hypothetical protein
MAELNQLTVAKQLLGIIAADEDRLERIDKYIHGHHDDPYMPDRADEEYKLLAKRAVSNWIPLLIGTPAQAAYVDNYRRGNSLTEIDSNGTPRLSGEDTLPEWKHWQHSRLDARQAAIYRGALGYGHSFTVTEKVKNKVVTKGLSALRTAAVFEDPANDDTPIAALTITRRATAEKPGQARMWDSRVEYIVSFKSLYDIENGVVVKVVKRHGASECPVTRFVASVDLEGRTVGVVEPMIPLQNRINQTIFDLLVAQTYGSFQVRTVTGMVPPQKMEPVRDEATGEIVDWTPVFDNDGQPVPANINLNARRFLFAEDHEAKFDSLPGTPLGGYIDSIDMSIRHLAAISQTPPHYLLGQIANLSAEALTAAETALSRKVEEFKHSWGESWERVFRLAAELNGDIAASDDFEGEIIWRDMENRSLAQAADALGKMADNLGIPKRGLWPRVPGATAREIEEWESLADQDPEVQLSLALNRATVDLTEHQSDLAEAQANLADVQAESNPGPAPTDNVFSGNTQSRVRQ